MKATLRGEFDQYFTPRELVDFMVKCADPEIGDLMLDPACGSGGFLIQAFNYVNAKISASGLSEVDRHREHFTLTQKCLWGHEADYDLHVLAKINLIMHGDGWNNIYQGDTLSSKMLPNDYFDLVLANPPFTISYTFRDVLSLYELGLGKESEELDILFVEKSIRALKPGCDLFIILPEGLLNIKRYEYFRKWLLEKTDLVMSVSLPEGAFIPFGGSVSKTSIIAVRKKGDTGAGYTAPRYVFLGRAQAVGYETGKKAYKPIQKNDLEEFLAYITEVFTCVKKTSNSGECGWIENSQVTSYRIDASYLLNKIDRAALLKEFPVIVSLNEICEICNETISISGEQEYQYLEVPDISDFTGVITNIRKVQGRDLGGVSFYKFYGGDILFTRINPRKSRVAIVPPIDGFGIVSKEVYRLGYKQNQYISRENRYALCPILQSQHVTDQIVRLSTGSSSSRARVQIEDLLSDVFVPIPNEDLQGQLSKKAEETMLEIWECAQRFLKTFEQNQQMLGSTLNKDDFRRL